MKISTVFPKPGIAAATARTGGALLAGLLLACTGCAAVGPASISNGRAVYNEVINNTEDEQLLNVIVRERYDQTFGMLTVASVTASIRVQANAGGQFGWGSKEAYAGNLVPLTTGVSYEESPTISYIPLSGEVFLSRMLAPITPSEAFLLLGAADNDATWAPGLFRRVNGMENPLGGPLPPRLQRFFDLYASLRRDGVLVMGNEASSHAAEPEYSVRISGYVDSHLAEVRELLDVLGLKDVKADGEDIVLPVIISSANDRSNAIHLQLRSVLEILRLAGRTIQVPAGQQESGVAPALETPGDSQHPMMTIHTSKIAPRNAVVAIPFRGWWYYIEDTDTQSKRAFKIIRLLVGLRLQEKGGESSGPVLTLPAR